jgi:hypothetical protein
MATQHSSSFPDPPANIAQLGLHQVASSCPAAAIRASRTTVYMTLTTKAQLGLHHVASSCPAAAKYPSAASSTLQHTHLHSHNFTLDT